MTLQFTTVPRSYLTVTVCDRELEDGCVGVDVLVDFPSVWRVLKHWWELVAVHADRHGGRVGAGTRWDALVSHLHSELEKE